jgi:CBS domain-containing protein
MMSLNDPISSVLKGKGSAVASIAPGQTVYEAIAAMAERGIGSLLVMADGRLVGIISERDYARKVVLKGKSSRETPVADIMSSPVIYVTPDRTVDECMAIMTQGRIRHLPVMEKDTVVGVVSIGDLVKWIASERAVTIRYLENYISSAYPG